MSVLILIATESLTYIVTTTLAFFELVIHLSVIHGVLQQIGLIIETLRLNTNHIPPCWVQVVLV